jgi:hypothetical protein
LTPASLILILVLVIRFDEGPDAPNDFNDLLRLEAFDQLRDPQIQLSYDAAGSHVRRSVEGHVHVLLSLAVNLERST